MKMDSIEINSDDTVLVMCPIGNLPSYEIDGYITKHLKTLKEVFQCEVAVVPSPDVSTMDFTVIKKVK